MKKFICIIFIATLTTNIQISSANQDMRCWKAFLITSSCQIVGVTYGLVTGSAYAATTTDPELKGRYMTTSFLTGLTLGTSVGTAITLRSSSVLRRSLGR